MQIKIISDGTPRGTKVVSAETGEPLNGVIAVDWHLDLKGHATAKIEFRFVPIEVIGELNEVKKET